MQLPWQTVAAHVDGAYFWGATRFQLPQWLLAAMVFSGRFADRFVNQVQVVAYLHRWAPESRVRGKAGGFDEALQSRFGLRLSADEPDCARLSAPELGQWN